MPKQKEKGGQGNYEQSRRYPTEDTTNGDKSREETEVCDSSVSNRADRSRDVPVISLRRRTHKQMAIALHISLGVTLCEPQVQNI